MATQPVSVYRFDYEIINAASISNWSAVIAAFNMGEAQKHLEKAVAKPIRILSSTMVSRLDDLSLELRQNVIDAFLNSTKGKQESEKKKK